MPWLGASCGLAEAGLGGTGLVSFETHPCAASPTNDRDAMRKPRTAHITNRVIQIFDLDGAAGRADRFCAENL